MKKKIVHLSTVHRSTDARITKELTTLADAGYEVVFIVPHSHDELINGVQLRAVRRSTTRLGRITRTAWAVLRQAVNEDADLYHIQHVPELLIYTYWLRLRGKIVVYDMHENVPKALLTKVWLPPVIRQLIGRTYRLLERLLIRKMPVVFAEESYVKDYPWVTDKSIVVLNMPIVDDLFKIDVPRHTLPTIGYIGSVNEQRGSLTTLDALKRLLEHGINVAWTCVGPTTQHHGSRLQNLVETYGLSDVKFYGYLPSQKGYTIIAGCHIGLAVLAPIPNYIESYPTKMFEYMALKQPVIVSGFPLYRRIVEALRCGICLDDPTNPEELANAIRWLIENPDEALAMGQRGYEAVKENYRWDTEAQKLLNFYTGLLGQ